MMSKEAFAEAHAEEFGDSPARIRAARPAFIEYVGLSPPRSLADVPEWYRSRKGVITKRLNDADADGDSDE